MSFEAKYHSTCADCCGPILPGEQIESVGNGYRHVSCPDDPVASLRATERVCPDCLMVRPCPCDDEGRAA